MKHLPLPKMKHCCYCTTKFRLACILIATWSMMSTAHSIRILFCPVCTKIYTREGGILYIPMIIIMWILLLVDVVLLSCSFFFLLSLFLKAYPITLDLFIIFGFFAAILMVIHASVTIAQIIASDCNNGSDSVAHFFYAILWAYFILIVYTYREEMNCEPGELVEDEDGNVKTSKERLGVSASGTKLPKKFQGHMNTQLKP
ncbi:hypothetical protein SFRURICE_008150 [Spodoptera frugiperda]|uniref:Uncharacterized protein LOC118269593 isoform X1 n=1 Tax=Spodoptera frugiperda TaxID=7108 RepID=A0A9R0D5B0_SPOFR|nr:uncharacterized protein LOC118269593 isoform X1 [Spodoptera frugiperda]XP_035440662.1 uncharacterized protein LOC118269593 isoform X1 [Spodoptera frugiperda]KAF9790133.1 hypothetical protein SFRURICE_008150 [Spodoptera frugiperda]